MNCIAFDRLKCTKQNSFLNVHNQRTLLPLKEVIIDCYPLHYLLRTHAWTINLFLPTFDPSRFPLQSLARIILLLPFTFTTISIEGRFGSNININRFHYSHQFVNI